MNERDSEQLSAYLDGELLPDEAAHVEAQLAASPKWQAARIEMERADRLLRGCHELPPARPEISESIARPGVEPSIRLPLVAAVVLLVVIAILVAVVWRSPADSPAVSSVPAVDTGQDAPESPSRVELREEPGAKPEPAAEPPSEPDVVAEEPLGLALAGTVLGQSPAAVLRDTKNGDEKVYRVGDAVRDDVTLTDVYEKEVVLDRNGETIRLTLGPLTMEAPPERKVSGLWRVVLAMDGQIENYGDVLTIEQDGQHIVVTDEDGESFATGTLEDRDLMLQFKEGHGVFVLRGELARTLDYVVMRFQGDTPFGSDVDPESLELRFTKVPDDEQTILRTLGEREREAREIRDALMAYALDHENLFPATLDMLVPDELESSSPYTTNEERRVTYDGQHRIALPDLAGVPRFDSFQPYLPLGERWRAYDELLRAQYGGDEWLEPATILTVEYSEPRVTYTVTARGDLHQKVHENEGRANASVPDSGTINAWITQDQQNLQQLRIFIQMFQNENEGYSPGGWVSIFPEYLTDPSILTSPKDDPGTNSYLYLHPGAQLQDLVAEEAGDPNVWINDRETADAIASEIPILLNRTDFPGPEPGRNVLYLDWHVAYVPRDSDEWRTYVEPHLRGNR
jgi:prepilin-type processing-associated H-X9-DG protein